MAECKSCGCETGGGKFCSYCGAPQLTDAGRGLPSPVLGPPADMPGRPAKQPAWLWICVAALAAAGIAGAIVAAVLLTGGGVTITIARPHNGSTIEGDTVRVKVDVSSPGKVARVVFYLDRKKRKTESSAPFDTELESLSGGVHDLEVVAWDSDGRRLAAASCTFETGGDESADGDSAGGEDGTSAFETALAGKVGEAGALDARISKLATRINNEVDFEAREVPSSLGSEAQAVYAKALSLASGVAALKPPVEMADLKARLEGLVEQLRIRADALLKGLPAVRYGGDYAAQFERGGAAKSSFDSAWPVFLENCRARGVRV